MPIDPTLIASMHDPERYKKFLADVELLKFRHPGATISTELHESKGNMSEMLNGKKEPSENFYKKFYEHYKEKLKGKNEDAPPENLRDRMLYKLINSNELLSDSNKILAASGRILAEKLPGKPTADDDPETLPVDQATFQRVQEFVLDVILGEVKFETREQALAELYKIAAFSQMKASEVGIRQKKSNLSKG